MRTIKVLPLILGVSIILSLLFSGLPWWLGLPATCVASGLFGLELAEYQNRKDRQARKERDD